MEGDGDGFKLEKMEGERALQRVIGFKICLRKTKEKKKRRESLQKIKDTGSEAACIKRGLRPSKKKTRKED